MPEMVKTTPRVKATPTAANPDLMLGVGEKGGISLYGLQRFPITLYWEQWQALLDEELVAEIAMFAEMNKASLSDGRQLTSKAAKDEGYTVNASDIALVAAEAQRLTEAGDVPGAIKYATIKSVATLNKFKVSPEDMLAIMTLKARK